MYCPLHQNMKTSLKKKNQKNATTMYVHKRTRRASKNINKKFLNKKKKEKKKKKLLIYWEKKYWDIEKYSFLILLNIFFLFPSYKTDFFPTPFGKLNLLEILNNGYVL